MKEGGSDWVLGAGCCELEMSQVWVWIMSLLSRRTVVGRAVLGLRVRELRDVFVALLLDGNEVTLELAHFTPKIVELLSRLGGLGFVLRRGWKRGVRDYVKLYVCQ